MFSISTKAGGLCQANPDACKTPAPPAPPLPLPYPNIAMCKQATPATCSKKVAIASQPVLTKDSVIPVSSGDEAGSAGGVVSGKSKGEVGYKTFSKKVKVEGKAVVYVTCVTAHNGKSANAVGQQLIPSQPKVKVSG